MIETIRQTIAGIVGTLGAVDAALKESKPLGHLPAAEALVFLSKLRGKIEDVADDLHAAIQQAAQGELFAREAQD